MAIKIDRQNGQNYAENLANSALSFNSGTWTVASGTGTSTISASTYFEGISSLKLQNNVPASDLTVTNSNHTTVIDLDGNYQISLHLRKDIALEQRQLDVLVYQNAVLLDTQSCLVGSTDADLDDNDEWVRYQLGSGYALNKLDEITFQFVLKGTATAEPTTIMFIDALMINPAERGNTIVPYYTKPNGGLYSDYTGWGVYNDTTYTTGSPFTVIDGAAAVALPNDAGSKIETQKPIDITTFYDGTVITGRNGDGLNITMEFKARPAGAGANPRITVAIDIGGAIGELYPRDFVLGKGSGVEHNIVMSYNVYTLDTWEANGGTVMVSADNEDIEVYDIRYVLTRSHKAR